MKKVLSFIPVRMAMLLGHFLLSGAGLLYALAWYLDFAHEGFMDLWYTKVIYYSSITAGVAGAVLLLDATRILILGLRGTRIRVWHIVALCLASYVVTLLLTTGVYGRIYTAELFLIFVWLAVQLTVLYALRYHGWISRSLLISSLAILLVATTTCLVLYNFYYSYTGRVQFLLGFIPYLLLSGTVLAIGLLLTFSGKEGPSDPGKSTTVHWSAHFRREALVTYAIWFSICTLATIPGWVYLFLHSYRGDMIATQWLLGLAYVLIILIVPVTIHYGIPGYGGLRRTGRVRWHGRGLTEELAGELEAAGMSTRTFPDQLLLPDLEMYRMQVIEVRDPRILVIVRELMAWPNPFGTRVQILWEVPDGNSKVIEDIIERKVGSRLIRTDDEASPGGEAPPEGPSG